MLLQKWDQNDVESVYAVRFSLTYANSQKGLMNIDRSLQPLSQRRLISVLLYESDAFEKKTNHKILIRTLQFIKDSHRFDNSLF